ncbi:MAG: PD-(D/E)XK nuclease domain-containing protein [Lachnospiraceae bacterium]|nr:PD-(D/E)XK nuclease domain-containing protein [Lachnospiraceae bacterium]
MRRQEKAYIFAFKVRDESGDETTPEDTVADALAQIEEKRCETALIANGFAPENIGKYGFGFQGQKCLIG